METLSYKCPACDAALKYDGKADRMTCEYCGSTMTLPKIDDDQRANAFNRGNHFRR